MLSDAFLKVYQLFEISTELCILYHYIVSLLVHILRIILFDFEFSYTLFGLTWKISFKYLEQLNMKTLFIGSQ